MKVALCISGQLRTFEQTFPALSKYFLEPFECDTFVSTWNDIGLSDSSASEVDPQGILERAGQLYQPVKMESESWASVRAQWGDLSFLDARRRADAYPERILGMWYKVWRANELKLARERESGFVYDMVVRSRADVLYFESPELKGASKGHIYIANKFGYGGLPDTFAFGPSHLMDIYASLFHHIYEYANLGCVVHPETLLEWHLRSSLPHGIVFSDIPFRLYRGDARSSDILMTWGRTK